ncbi:MAG: alpha-1,2-fucosyltransferase [Lachnospiraceae bacterium]|nr:alpha-1,2-fucosyltransferase [Lachnospiraceae bacterium]
MIFLNLTGGLGNQLFEYAFARKFQKKTGTPIQISTYEISRFIENRQPSINQYKLNDGVSFTTRKFPWYVDRRNYLAKILRRVSPSMFFNIFSKRGAFVWYEDKYIEIPNTNSKDVYIGGYWQSENYFREILPILRKEFVPRKMPMESKRLLEEIKGEEDNVCLHVRRGDYFLTKNDIYQVCTLDYFNSAVAKMREHTNGRIYVFSDDIEWCQYNLNIKGEHKFVTFNNPDFLDLYLMSNCSNFIISNSTFSWWAQELSSNPKKVVIAPSKWRNDTSYDFIYKSEWKLIDV